MALKRNIIFKIRLSFTENSVIKAKAKTVGLSKSRFVRELALDKEIKTRTFTEEEKRLFIVLVRLSNNMNQIAKRYHQGERIHVELIKTIAETQTLIDKLTHNDR